jgi:ABC-type sugar transport system substrate-binding protein
MMNTRSVVVAFIALLAACAASTAPAQQGEGPRIALVIGNANYPDADAPLKQPVQDARALADELKRNGFEVDVAVNLTK